MQLVQCSVCSAFSGAYEAKISGLHSVEIDIFYWDGLRSKKVRGLRNCQSNNFYRLIDVICYFSRSIGGFFLRSLSMNIILFGLEYIFKKNYYQPSECERKRKDLSFQSRMYIFHYLLFKLPIIWRLVKKTGCRNVEKNELTQQVCALGKFTSSQHQ